MKKIFLICCFFNISIYCAEIEWEDQFQKLEDTEVAGDIPKVASDIQNLKDELTDLINQAKKEFLEELKKLKNETESKENGQEIFQQGFEELKKEFDKKIQNIYQFINTSLVEKDSKIYEQLSEYNQRLQVLELNKESYKPTEYVDRLELNAVANRLEKLEKKSSRSSCFGFLSRRKDNYKKIV